MINTHIIQCQIKHFIGDKRYESLQITINDKTSSLRKQTKSLIHLFSHKSKYSELILGNFSKQIVFLTYSKLHFISITTSLSLKQKYHKNSST